MNILFLAETLGFDIMDDFSKLGKCSSHFIGLLVSNFKNETNEIYKWVTISHERLEKMKQTKGIEIIAENEKVTLYRFTNKLFINKNFGEVVKGKRIA